MSSANEIKECYGSLSSHVRLISRDKLTPCLRILSGSIDIYSAKDDREYEIKKNYFISLNDKNRYQRACKIYEVLGSINNKKYDEFRLKINNQDFFKTLCDELTAFSINQYRKNYTNSFIHIYRLLEHISYAFPMLYSSKSKDFRQTYNLLQSYFENGTKSELAFFKNFLEKALNGNSLLDTEITIKFKGTEDQKEKFFKLVNTHTKTTSESEFDEIKISWISMPELIIRLRNGFFHYMNGRGNIENHQIIDSDLFFENINDPFMMWFSSILQEIICQIFIDLGI